MKVILTFILLLFYSNSHSRTVLVTGTIKSENTQHILMPLIESFNGKVNEIITEGTQVKAGELIAKVDGSYIDEKINSLKEQLESSTEKAKKSAIESKIALSSSQLSFDKAATQLKIAQMKSELPKNYIGALKYQQNQLNYKQKQKTFNKAQNDLIEAKLKDQEIKSSNKKDLEQKQKKLNVQQKLLNSLSLYATQEGYVVNSNHPWTGKKIQAGDQLQTGMEILTISQNNNLKIIGWLNAIDIPHIFLHQKVSVSFDAYLSKVFQGEITTISHGGAERKNWGDALYYRIEVKLLEKPQLNLLVGMSALIETQELDNE